MTGGVSREDAVESPTRAAPMLSTQTSHLFPKPRGSVTSCLQSPLTCLHCPAHSILRGFLGNEGVFLKLHFSCFVLFLSESVIVIIILCSFCGSPNQLSSALMTTVDLNEIWQMPSRRDCSGQVCFLEMQGVADPICGLGAFVIYFCKN